jgi:hypothetical protein
MNFFAKKQTNKMNRYKDNSRNANVISCIFKGDGIKWAPKTINGSQYKIAELFISEVTEDIINNGIVLVYVGHSTTDINTWSALPISFPDGSNSVYLGYGISTGKVFLRASQEDSTVPPSIDIDFRVVVIQGNTANNTIDMFNYKSIIDL